MLFYLTKRLWAFHRLETRVLSIFYQSVIFLAEDIKNVLGFFRCKQLIFLGFKSIINQLYYALILIA